MQPHNVWFNPTGFTGPARSHCARPTPTNGSGTGLGGRSSASTSGASLASTDGVQSTASRHGDGHGQMMNPVGQGLRRTCPDDVDNFVTFSGNTWNTPAHATARPAASTPPIRASTRSASIQPDGPEGQSDPRGVDLDESIRHIAGVRIGFTEGVPWAVRSTPSGPAPARRRSRPRGRPGGLEHDDEVEYDLGEVDLLPGQLGPSADTTPSTEPLGHLGDHDSVSVDLTGSTAARATALEPTATNPSGSPRWPRPALLLRAVVRLMTQNPPAPARRRS